MTLFYVGLARNTETGLVNPVSAAATEREAEILLREWLKEADRVYGKGSRVSAGTAFIRSNYCAGVTVVREEQVKMAHERLRKEYLAALQSLKESIEEEMRTFEGDPLSTPSASIDVGAMSLVKKSRLFRMETEVLKSAKEE